MPKQKQDYNFGKSRYSTAYAKTLARKYKSFNLPSPRFYTGYFGFKFLQLINLPFKNWKAYKLGIIDEDGNELRKAETFGEKEYYNYYVKLIIRLKQLLRKQLPDIRRHLVYNKLFLVRESYNYNDVLDKIDFFFTEMDKINNKEINYIIESVFAGDTAIMGTPMNVGRRGGPRNPDICPRNKDKKKKKKLYNFKEYILKDLK